MLGQTASAVGPMVSGFLQAVSTDLDQTIDGNPRVRSAGHL